MEDLNSRLKQIKMDALTAKILHRGRIAFYNKINLTHKIFSILVPLFYFIPLYFSKGTTYEQLVNMLSVIMTILLLIITLLILLFKVEEKIEQHKLGLNKNLNVINEVDLLLQSSNENKDLSWFFRFVNEIDKSDNDIFAPINNNDKQGAYRNALKEFSSGKVEVCPICESSPWNYEPGDCQLCGNKIKGGKNV